MASRPCVLVVGGGILGVSLAERCISEGIDVVLYRLSDREVPCADTLRNQAWLLSGVRILEKDGRSEEEFLVAAKSMRQSGLTLLDRARLPRPVEDSFGIVRERDDKSAETLLKNAAKLGVRIDPLPSDDAEALLGPLFESGSPYLTTPDLPFDEATVLSELRSTVVAAGASIRELTEPVRLVRDKTPKGFRVEAAGEILDFPMTVLAAGAGTLPLLASIGVKDLVVSQTPLLVLPTPSGMAAPLFHDRVRNMSVVCHRGGRMVVGLGGFRRDVEFTAPQTRRIPAEEVERFWKRLPPVLGHKKTTAASRPVSSRSQACWLMTNHGSRTSSRE